jgi:hypothetical protein
LLTCLSCARHSEEPTATKNLDPSLFAQDDNRAGSPYFLQRIGNHGDVARRVFAAFCGSGFKSPNPIISVFLLIPNQPPPQAEIFFYNFTMDEAEAQGSLTVRPADDMDVGGDGRLQRIFYLRLSGSNVHDRTAI